MKLLKNFKRNDGFSLIELITASSLSLVMATAFYAAFFGMRNQFAQQDNFYLNNQAVRFALDKIARDAEEAVSVVYTYGGDTRADNVLILKLPSIYSHTDPTHPDEPIDISDASGKFDYVTYKLNGSDLTRTLDVQNSSQREGGADISGRVIAKNVTILLFTSSGSNLSTFTSSTITGIKTLKASVTARLSVRGKYQTTQADADLMIRNNIT